MEDSSGGLDDPTGGVSLGASGESADGDHGEDEDEDDDQEEFHAAEEQSHITVQPRWPTRVFAAECVRRIIMACHGARTAHFDLALAKEQQLTKSRGMGGSLQTTYILSYFENKAISVLWVLLSHCKVVVLI